LNPSTGIVSVPSHAQGFEVLANVSRPMLRGRESDFVLTSLVRQVREYVFSIPDLPDRLEPILNREPRERVRKGFI